jgi:AcrR family transcriptional regulator
LAIIDEQDIDALSMRTLAKRLGVQAPSLYNHFANKEEILDAVARRILQELQARKAENEPWQDWFGHAMLEYWRILMAHPNAVHLMTRVPLASFISDATFEHAVSVMEDDGVPPALILTIAEAAEALVTGWVLFTVANVQSHERRGVTTRRRIVELNTLSDERRFETACYALLNGFVAQLMFQRPTHLSGKRVARDRRRR